MVSRDRKLRKRDTPPSAPDNNASTILRRPVRSSLQDVKADLIAASPEVSVGSTHGDGADDDVPERGQGAKYELDDAVRDCLSFLWTWLVDLQLVIQEAKHVFQEEELRLVELGVGEHVAHQRVSTMCAESSVRCRRNDTTRH
jgi:hypothetical protein